MSGSGLFRVRVRVWFRSASGLVRVWVRDSCPVRVWFVSGFAIVFVTDSCLVGTWNRDRVMSKFVFGSCLGSGACLVRVCFASVSYLASCLGSYSVLFWLVVKVVWFDE